VNTAAAPAAPSTRGRGPLALLALGLAAAAAVLAMSPLTWRADRLWQDLLVASLSRPPPADTLIVAIDDASLAAVGRWPWPRTVQATLLRGMAAAGPRSITLDLVLSEPEPAGDPWLAAEIAAATRAGVPVLLPVSWQPGPGGLDLLLPTPALRGAVRLGAAEAAVDADGVLRHLFLQAGPPDAPYPHLARAVLEAGGGRLHPSLRPAWNPAPEPGRWQRDGRLVMRFGGAPGAVPRVSALDVLQGRVAPAQLAGRDLLLGLTAQGLGDTLATPVNAGHRAMPGVEALAHGLALLRHGGSPRPVPAGAVAAGSALGLVLLLALLQRVGERRALALALGSVPLVALASAASAHAGWLWSPLPFVLPALLAYPLWSWLRLRRAMQVLAAEIRELAAARQAGGAAAPAPEGLEPQIAELQRAGAQLREAHRERAALLEGLPTAVLVGDASGRVRLGNALAAALFEVGEAHELQGLDLPRLLGELQAEPAPDWRRRLAELQPEGDGLALEVRLGPHELLLHARALRGGDGALTLVSLADLAPVREAQRAREETLAFVSHDLRGPAATIVLLTQLHAEGRSPHDADALMPELRALAQRTLDLADDFVLAARAQSRPLQPQPVTAAALLDAALHEALPQARAAGVRLEPAEPAAALAHRPWLLDPRLVQRALANLLGNALRHAPAGGWVRLAAWAEGDTLVLEVSDNGPGLSAAQRAQLAAGAAPGSTAPGGSGFGLAFVQQVATRHGGTLRAAAGAGGRLQLRLRGASGNP
jgi:CHASE2 domain-containing sensor protein/signal transduction histidine kinase